VRIFCGLAGTTENTGNDEITATPLVWNYQLSKGYLLDLSIPLSRRLLCASATAARLACHGPAAPVGTLRDTLVIAFSFDDIITLDPAEAFELSAGLAADVSRHRRS
jgi:hypothetical protein